MTAAVALGERSPDIKASVVAAVWIGFAVLAVRVLRPAGRHHSGLDAARYRRNGGLDWTPPSPAS